MLNLFSRLTLPEDHKSNKYLKTTRDSKHNLLLFSKLKILFLLIALGLLFATHLSAFYKDIPVTRDLDPTAEYDTYQEWSTDHPEEGTFTREMSRNFSPARDKSFLIVVADYLYDDISSAMQTYEADLNEEGFNTIILEFSGSSIDTLKSKIVNYYNLYNLKNAVLIGDLPVSWFELFEDWNNNGIQDDDESWVEFPCDLYFSDIDGTWMDLDQNGILDIHEGDKHPEIGIGRITAYNIMLGEDEAELVNEYFSRNHFFRKGIIPANDTSLAYIDDDWSNWGDQYKTAMQLAYPSVELVDDVEATNAQDYKNPRLIADYEMIQVHVHSGPDAHYFYYNNGSSYELVHNYDIPPINPNAHFYNLFACSNSRFTTANNMGAIYVYGSDYCLGTLGSTKTGSMLNFEEFYQPFADSTLGQSLQSWWCQSVDVGDDWRWQRAWFYGMIIQGDPSLKREYVPCSNLDVEGYAYLENQTNHSDIEVTLQMTWPQDSTYTAITDPSGYFSVNIPGGIYELSYEKDGYFPEFAEEQTLAENTTFPDITLLEHTSIINVPARFSTIQTAIEYALENDTVLVDTGTYYESLDFLGKNITVASKYLTTGENSYISQTILDGGQNGRVVKFDSVSTNTVLEGFTIQNGYVSGDYPEGYGGAIFCFDCDPEIKNLVIKNNSAEYGSAIYCENAAPEIENLIILDNNCFEDGTIYCSNANPDFYNIILSNNSANIGAGICCWDSNPTISNATISHNQNSSGSTIFSYNSNLSLYNSIISYNTGNYGIYNYSGNAIVEYCDFYNNENGNFYNCSPGTGCIESAPLFADTTSSDFHLTQDSPCIDTGTPDPAGLNLPFWDLDGNIRIWDGNDDGIARIDMGAYEYDAPVYSVDELEPPQEMTIYNYPNPAQNSTTIKYSLKSNSHVKINIYNVKGQLVKNLVHRPQNMGVHTVNFVTKELSSGVYFYRIRTEDITRTKKMLVIE